MNTSTSLKEDEESGYTQVNETFQTGQTSDLLLIDPPSNRYPYCIVWTRAPKLTWWGLPCFGHVGIAG